MLTLHHLENSQSIRILWLLEEVGLDYDFKMYDRDPKTMLAPDEYKALSPLGTAPVITDGSITLAESNAIIDYILDKANAKPWRPDSGSKNRPAYLFWFHTAQGSFQSILTTGFVLSLTVQRTPALIRPLINKVLSVLQDNFVKPRLTRILEKMEADLSTSKFLAGGRITGADIAVGYTLDMAAMRGLLNSYPECAAYLQRMKDRPAYKAALKKDGKFTGIPTRKT